MRVFAPPSKSRERDDESEVHGEKTTERASCEVRLLSSRPSSLSSRHILKISSFPGHAPGKDTLRAANAATERGLTGENARANAVSGRALSPVKRKRGSTGEKTHEQAFCVARELSSPSYNKKMSFPGHAPGKDTLRAANAATKEGVNGGENGLSVSDYPLSSPSK